MDNVLTKFFLIYFNFFNQQQEQDLCSRTSLQMDLAKIPTNMFSKNLKLTHHTKGCYTLIIKQFPLGDNCNRDRQEVSGQKKENDRKQKFLKLRTWLMMRISPMSYELLPPSHGVIFAAFFTVITYLI